jgi:peptide/nickel transport system ATP-binding protein
VRRDLQLVFQDPYASLNPRRRVGDILSEPLQIHHYGDRRATAGRVQELLEVVEVDVSIQAQVLNLFADLQDQFGLTYVFIAHDLGVVRHMSTRIAVMYLDVEEEVAPGRHVACHFPLVTPSGDAAPHALPVTAEDQ